MRRRRTALLSTLGLSLLACGGGAPPAQSAQQAPVAVAAPPPVAPDADGYQFTPDALRPYRSYVHVSEVGEYAHHFWVWRLQGARWVSQQVWVNAEGDTRTVHLGDRHAFARENLAVRLRPPSREAANAARAVRAQFARETAKVEFRGSYRQVVVNEIIPVDIAPYSSHMARTKAILHVNSDFSEIIATPATHRSRYRTGHGSAGSDHDFGSAPPHWVALPVDNGGRAYLNGQFRRGTTAQDRSTREAILAATRAFFRREPGPALTELHGQDSGQLLPQGVKPRLEYRVLIGGGQRTRNATGRKLPTEHISVAFDPRDMALGNAQARGAAKYNGEMYHADVHLRLLTDLSGITTPAQVPVQAQLTVKITGPHAQPLVRVYEMSGAALVDGTRIAIPKLTATKPHRRAYDRNYTPGPKRVMVRNGFSVLSTFD